MRGRSILDRDFKSDRRLFTRKPRHRRWLWLPLTLTGVALMATFRPQGPAAVEADPLPASALAALALPVPPARLTRAVTVDMSTTTAAITPAPGDPHENGLSPDGGKTIETPDIWDTLHVESGDSLSMLFSRAGLSAVDLHRALNADGESTAPLLRLYPGDSIRVRTDQDGLLLALQHDIDEERSLLVEREADGFTASLLTTPAEIQTAEVIGVIESSLFNAGRKTGLEDRLIMELAGIFAWDVDFALDIRAGDSFALVYETLYRDGSYLRGGNILAAEFVNQGRTYRAVRHVDSEGHAAYYSPGGRSMRKAFLRSPVDFHRISSHFNPNRLHPVLGERRPHRGVDYAAPTGTPIRAAGDGRIVHLGRRGGYGHTIVIQHGTRYSTLYAHMSRYADGLSNGSRVRQGQVIGYVGMSGMATGPHLHYEFLVDGVHRDPVRVKLPDAEPIADRYRAEFERTSRPLLARLDRIQPQQLALRDDE